jgi:hypothetical protein
MRLVVTGERSTKQPRVMRQHRVQLYSGISIIVQSKIALLILPEAELQIPSHRGNQAVTRTDEDSRPLAGCRPDPAIVYDEDKFTPADAAQITLPPKRCLNFERCRSCPPGKDLSGDTFDVTFPKID